MTCFMVVGTPRGGTSLTAGILHHLGIFMGNEFMPTDDWNPKGTFADIEFEAMCNSIYGMIVPAYNLPISLYHKDKLQTLVEQREALGIDWGFKCSRATFIADEVALHTNLKAVVVHRNKETSLQSFMARSSASFNESANIILRSHSDVQRFVNTTSIPFIEVNFDDIVDNPVESVTAIASFCGKEVTDNALNFPDVELRRF